MCLFCLAVFAVLAGAVTKAVVNKVEQQLASVAEDRVELVTDTASTAVFRLEVAVPSVQGQPPAEIAAAPVTVAVYKPQKRVRIQVRTHDVTVEQAHAIQDLVAQACGLKVISRSSEQHRHAVTDAMKEVVVRAAHQERVSPAPRTQQDSGQW